MFTFDCDFGLCSLLSVMYVFRIFFNSSQSVYGEGERERERMGCDHKRFTIFLITVCAALKREIDWDTLK
jgi:hypothetical protein